MALSMFGVTASAAQENHYHDPADHWLTANNRTNELDANAVVTHETFYCYICEKDTSFTAWRTPEYTRDGVSALSRNVLYSDGTMVDGEGTGRILDGTPGVDAYYTGYHWTKSNCDTCGTMNSHGLVTGYGFNKNVYTLYDCAAEFTEELEEKTTYEYADDSYHRKNTLSGTYCCFCFGTNKEESSKLERHSLETGVLPQPANGRFATLRSCSLCDYIEYDYTAAKSVVADYYGVVDGQPHTLSVTDLSEGGVSTQIRYGNSADSCTMTSAPNYTEEGQYTVYYEITYTYKNTDMTENGVAYVWLRDEAASGENCSCGCGDPDCGCQDKNCNGGCCNKPCQGHHFTLLDSVKASCLTLGYDRYLCTECGRIEKRDYVSPLGHAWQGVVVREATCESDGKLMEICSRCGQVKVSATPKGEHRFRTYSVEPTCTSSGYTVRECSVCGERHIEDITNALPHNYHEHTIPATCDNGGKTIHLCENCGSSFVTDYTEPLGHSWDKGTFVTNATCTGEGVMEYRCVRCGYHRLDTNAANGHVPGKAATCTEPQLCTKCGAVIVNALGHNFKSVITPATCLKMGWTEYTCDRCGENYKSDYTDALGHDYIPVVTLPTCTEGGYTTFTCSCCGDSYVDDYTEKLGHAWDKGERITVPTCGGEGVLMFRCERCSEHYLEAISPDGHTAGAAATCTQPQLCTKCGAVLVKALEHKYKAEIKAPTCTEMGYTVFTCEHCKDSYKGEYTDPTGHKFSDWIVDKQPTTSSEGQRHKECLNCHVKLETEVLEKLYNSATTDSKGEAVVGGYLVIVTDTKSDDPVANATVTLSKNNTLSIRLPNSRLLDYEKQTTVTVLLTKDKSPVSNLFISVTDKNNNYSAEKTDKSGQITVPSTSGVTGPDGNTTFGYTDADGDKFTITVKVEDYENGRPIKDATVTIGKTGTITVTLPDGMDIDGDNRIVITVTDNNKKPIKDKNVVVKGDRDRESGKTDEDGKLIVPEILRREKHGAYIYGYEDGTFRPEGDMTRAEAAAIFARPAGGTERRDDKEHRQSQV